MSENVKKNANEQSASGNELDKMKELTELMSNSIIKAASSRPRPLPVRSKSAERKSDRALTIWLAVQTRVWLKENHAASTPLIEKIWLFDKGRADVDMRIGIHNEYRKIKVTTESTGPTSFRLKIQTWQRSGKPEKAWERYGVFRGNDTEASIETLPIR